MHIEIGPGVQGHFQGLMYEQLIELSKVGAQVFTANCEFNGADYEFSTTNANLALFLASLGDYGRRNVVAVLYESFQRTPQDKQRLLLARLPNEEKPRNAMLVTMAKDEFNIIFHCSPAR